MQLMPPCPVPTHWSDLSTFRTNTVANASYVKDRFVEDMGKVVAKARADVNAYAERALINTGVQCLMNEVTNKLPNAESEI